MDVRLPCRLLIVEDETVDQMVYKFLLKKGMPWDMQTTFASSGTEALDLLRSTAFDCMLLDFELNDMTGLDLIDAVIQSDHALPCATVIVTGNHSEEISSEAALRGIRSILLKDQIDEGHLIRAINLAMAATPVSLTSRTHCDDMSGNARSAPPPPMLNLAAAKLALARSLGLDPANLEITIRV